MLQIVINQRDRFKARILELETVSYNEIEFVSFLFYEAKQRSSPKGR